MSKHEVELLQQEVKHLRELLRLDELSGLGNLRALKEDLKSMREATLGVLFLDIDHFKEVNEEHGHLAASGVLTQLGAMLSAISASRGYSSYRYGGDEFVVLVKESDLDSLNKVGSQLCELISRRIFSVDGHNGHQRIGITVSIGCQLKRQRDSAQKILSEADKAMYEAKRKSRNVALSYSA